MEVTYAYSKVTLMKVEFFHFSQIQSLEVVRDMDGDPLFDVTLVPDAVPTEEMSVIGEVSHYLIVFGRKRGYKIDVLLRINSDLTKSSYEGAKWEFDTYFGKEKPR